MSHHSPRGTADEAERQAAHRVLNQLDTTVALRPLSPDGGLPREALGSLYRIVTEVRAIRLHPTRPLPAWQDPYPASTDSASGTVNAPA